MLNNKDIIIRCVIILFVEINCIFPDENVFAIKTDGCLIPALRANDETIMNFVHYPHDVAKCSDRNKPDLLGHNNTHIWVKQENLDLYFIYNQDEFICCYKNFSNSLFRFEISECVLFKDSIHVERNHEFVYVECLYLNYNIYKDFFAFTPQKNQPRKTVRKQLNVLILGSESISRLNFHRTMPKTSKFLKDNEAIEFLGYNKLGDNSLPNLIPLLTGKQYDEANAHCLEHNVWNQSRCHFLWDDYESVGYNTAMGADSSVGLFESYFSYKNRPTHYNLYPFISQSTKVIGHNKPLNYHLCMGNKYYYFVLFDYITKLIKRLFNDKLFGFFWQESISHDFFNNPMIMDKDYVKFLKTLRNIGFFKDSVVILISDHGFRWGDIVQTVQGRIEERLPFIYFLIPPTFKKRYSKAYKNLKNNAKRLTTAYDVYYTIRDLVDMTQIENSMIAIRETKSCYLERGISLFLEIPTNRTCNTAGIEQHWCTCYNGKRIEADEESAQEAANQLIFHINQLLVNYKQCEKLSIKEILSVVVIEDHLGQSYNVIVKAYPSYAIFDGTLRHERELWALSGTVSRLDRYDNQGSCIDNKLFKMYCCCR